MSLQLRATPELVATAWLKEGAVSFDDRPLAFSLYSTFLAAHADSKDDATEALRVEAADSARN